MLDRSDHTRKLDRHRRAEADKRKRAADPLRCYPYWLTATEAAEIIADMRRIEVDPKSDDAKDLKALDDSSITNKEFCKIVGRLARAHHKHLKAAFEKMRSRVRSPTEF